MMQMMRMLRMLRMNVLRTVEVVRVLRTLRMLRDASAHHWNRMLCQRMNGRHVDVEGIAIRFDGIIQRRHLRHHRRVSVAVRTRRHHVGATVINPLLSRLFKLKSNRY